MPEFTHVKEGDLNEVELTPEEIDRVLNEEVEASKKVPRFSNFFRKKEKETSLKYADDSEVSKEEIDRILFGK